MRSVRRANTGVGRGMRRAGPALLGAAVWLACVLNGGVAAAQLFEPPIFVMGSCFNYEALPSSVELGPGETTGSFELAWSFSPPQEGPNTVCTIPCITGHCAILASYGNVSSSASWLSGEGSFTLDDYEFSYVVTYTVAANPGGQREGTLSVSEATFRVTQERAECSSLSVTPDELEFTHEGGSSTVDVTQSGYCLGSVTVTVDQGNSDEIWLGAAVNNDGDVVATVLPHTGSMPRTGTVTVTGDGRSDTVSVTQNPPPCTAPTVVPDAHTFEYTGGDLSVDVTQPDHCTATVSVTAVGNWLGASPASVTGNGPVTVSAARNPTSEEREGTVTVENTGGSRSVPVTQEPRPEPPCPETPSGLPTSVTFDSGAASRMFPLVGDSSCSWPVSVSSGDAGWLGASLAWVNGGWKLTVTVTENNGAQRNGTVRVGSGSFPVSQNAPPCTAPTVVPDSLTFEYTAGRQGVTVNKDPDCTAALSVDVDQGDSDENWLRASVDSNGTLTVTATRNTGTSSRMGTVTVSDDGGSARVDVRQDPPPCPASPDRVSPPELEFRYEGEDKTATVHGPNDCTWDVRVRGTGFRTRDGQTSVSGGGTVTVRAERNDGAERRGTLSVGGETTPLIQNPAPCGSPTVTPDELDFPHEGETRYVTVGGGTDCSWPVSENLSWIEDVPARVSGGDRVPVTATRNYGAFRSGEISFGGAPLRVRQDPAPCTAPSVSPPSLTFEHTGGDLSVGVTQPAHCTATVSVTAGSTWLSRITTSVIGNGNVVVNAREHTGIASRPGEVTIGNTGGSTPVPVTQNPPPPPEPCTAPAVDPASLTFTDAGGELSVGVTQPAHCTSAVSVTDTWLRTDPASLTGGGTVTVTADPNAGSGERDALVTVTNAGGSASVSVMQAGPCPAAPESVSATSLSFDRLDGSRRVTVGGSGACSWEVTWDRQWLLVRPARVPEGGSVTILVAPNEYADARSGTVLIGAQAVTVEQTGSGPPTVNAGPDQVVGFGAPVVLDGMGTDAHGDQLLYAWFQDSGPAVRLGNELAARTTFTAPQSEAELVFTLFAFNESAARGEDTVSVLVSAAGPCPDGPEAAAPSSLNLGHAAYTGTVAIQGRSECAWPVSVTTDDAADEAWLTATLAPVHGGERVTVDVTANGTSTARTGTVMVGSLAVGVTQAGLPCPEGPDSLSSTSVDLEPGGGSTRVAVSGRSDCAWPVVVEMAVDTENLWLGASPEMVAGGGEVTIEAMANGTSTARTGTVSVGSLAVGVTQAGLPCPEGPDSLSSTSESFDHRADSRDLTVSGRSDCSWPVAVVMHEDAASGWLNIYPESVSGGGRMSIEVTANGDSVARTGSVTVGNLAVEVTQAGLTCPTAPEIVEPSVFYLWHGESTVQVSANGGGACAWAVAVTMGEEWIDAAPEEVSAGDTVTLQVDPNVGPERQGVVEVGTRTVTVWQEAAPCPAGPEAIEPPLVSLGHGAGETTVEVRGRSDCSWEVAVTTETDAASRWLERYPESVSGGGTVTLTVTANAGNARTGTVWVGARMAPVTQAGSNVAPTAEAGADQRVAVGALVTLDGAGSSDPEGQALEYAWTQTAGMAAQLQGTSASAVAATFLAPATPGDDVLEFSLTVTDAHGGAASDTVGVTVLGAALSGHRDRLLGTWPPAAGDACRAYHDLDPSARRIYIWNTHRLDITGLLADVDALHGVNGQYLALACDGAGYNRTYMSMTADLNARLARAARGAADAVPGWRAAVDGPLIDMLLEHHPGPHGYPPDAYDHLVETADDILPGLIHFYDASRVHVERQHFAGAGSDGEPPASCGVEQLFVAESEVCTAEAGCAGDAAVGGCATTTYRDTVVWRPGDAHERGPGGQGVRIEDAHFFEMYQSNRRDDSASTNCPVPMPPAPEVITAAELYVHAYGDPNWSWEPTACQAAWQPRAPFTHTDITEGSTPTRAVHVTQLRARVNGLRARFGLTPFAWTDATIVFGVTPVKAVHLTELRAALDAAYAAAGRTAPAYTDSAVVAGVTPVKAVHVTELRLAVGTLEREQDGG